jgi:hypothetical protein
LREATINLFAGGNALADAHALLSIVKEGFHPSYYYWLNVEIN